METIYIYLLDEGTIHRVNKAFRTKESLLTYLNDVVGRRASRWNNEFNLDYLVRELNKPVDSEYGDSFQLCYQANSGANCTMKIIVLKIKEGTNI